MLEIPLRLQEMNLHPFESHFGSHGQLEQAFGEYEEMVERMAKDCVDRCDLSAFDATGSSGALLVVIGGVRYVLDPASDVLRTVCWNSKNEAREMRVHCTSESGIGTDPPLLQTSYEFVCLQYLLDSLSRSRWQHCALSVHLLVASAQRNTPMELESCSDS